VLYFVVHPLPVVFNKPSTSGNCEDFLRPIVHSKSGDTNFTA